MDRLEQSLDQAANPTQRQILADSKELGYFALALSLFRGRLAWITWVVMLVQGALAIGSFWCAWQFFHATDTLTALQWGLPGAVLILMATSLKLSLMSQMQAERVLRELRRVELLLIAS